MTIWHEDRLLIDGELVAAENGATYETISPSTEEVLGTAADASVADARTRDRRGAARVRHDRVVARPRPARPLPAPAPPGAASTTSRRSREILVHEVGAPVSSTSGPQLAGPIDVVALVRRPARGVRVRRRPRRARHVGRPQQPLDREGSRRRRRRDRRVQLPDPARAREARTGARGRLHRRAQGRARHAVGDARARQADRRVDRHPGRRRERARRRPTTRSAPS